MEEKLTEEQIYTPVDMDRLKEIQQKYGIEQQKSEMLMLFQNFLEERGLIEEFRDWVKSSMQYEANQCR